MNHADLSGRRILIIEDEHLVAEALSRALRLSGAVIVGPAATVEQALELTRATRCIDGALLDINLRGVPGYVVADALVARSVPFVFATGYGTSSIPERYRHIATLQKPFDPEQVAAALFPVFPGR
jgi:CheY-like chemotaxis protein